MGSHWTGTSHHWQGGPCPHLVGLCGEIAYSRRTGQDIDRRILSKGDHADFTGVEVKTSRWAGRDIELKVKQYEYQKKHPVGYVLARLHRPFKVEFIGSIFREDFERFKYARKHTTILNWCVQGDDLIWGLLIQENKGARIVPFQKAGDNLGDNLVDTPLDINYTRP